MTTDTDDIKRLVQNFAAESSGYFRQLHIWLGAASAGGVIALATLAASLPDPEHALRFFSFSFWMFLIGIVAAGSSTLALAMRSAEKGNHFAHAHNRDNLKSALDAMPQLLSSPSKLAENSSLNRQRRSFIAQHDHEHSQAEEAWRAQSRWRIFWIVALTVSSLAFVGGFSWPLLKLDVLDQGITPIIETSGRN